MFESLSWEEDVIGELVAMKVLFADSCFMCRYGKLLSLLIAQFKDIVTLKAIQKACEG